MCAVSFVADDWRQRFPFPTQIPEVTLWQVQEEIRKALEEDHKNGTPDCSTGEKKEYLDAIMKRIEILEQKIGVAPPEEKKIT